MVLDHRQEAVHGGASETQLEARGEGSGGQRQGQVERAGLAGCQVEPEPHHVGQAGGGERLVGGQLGAGAARAGWAYVAGVALGPGVTAVTLGTRLPGLAWGTRWPRIAGVALDARGARLAGLPRWALGARVASRAGWTRTTSWPGVARCPSWPSITRGPGLTGRAYVAGWAWGPSRAHVAGRAGRTSTTRCTWCAVLTWWPSGALGASGPSLTWCAGRASPAYLTRRASVTWWARVASRARCATFPRRAWWASGSRCPSCAWFTRGARLAGVALDANAAAEVRQQHRLVAARPVTHHDVLALHVHRS